MSRRSARASAAALLLAAGCGAAWGPAAAQEEDSAFLAFGDSITRGGSQFDEENRGGYPGRLQARLRQADPAAVVYNFGRDGEVTAEGLSRVGNVLELVDADAFLLMEGTNDINKVIEGSISFESIENNLAGIAARAASAGLRIYYGNLLPRPPGVNLDRSNVLTFALSRALRDLAYRQQRGLVDVWEGFFFEPGAFRRLYSPTQGGVGHPNAAGFAFMADLFFDVVRGIDSVGPVPGALSPTYGTDEIAPGDPIELTIYDFGAGIDAAGVTLTINGEPVATTHSGSERRRILNHDATAQSLGCYAQVGFAASDLADPPNVTDRVYKEFTVAGGRILKGDLNRSCRVDGADLLIVAFAFGARNGEPRYSKLADINDDNIVDGRDLAELAGNFGESS